MKEKIKNSKRLTKLPPLEITPYTMKKIMDGKNYLLVITSVIGRRDKGGTIVSAKVVIPKKPKRKIY